MAALHQTSNSRRILASPPDPQAPMDPPLKKHPKPTPFSAAHRHPQPPDPTPPSTIQNISQRFSKLYNNQKKLYSNNPSKIHHPQPEPYFQGKPLSYSPLSDTSCTTLTKSSSLHERNRTRNHNSRKTEDYFTTKTKVKEKDSTKNPISKTKNPSFEEHDVKKSSKLMSKSMDVKRSEEGFVEGRRSSVSSMSNNGGGGRRRSFCSSQVELADFLSCNGVKIVAVDMPPFMQIHAVDSARKIHDSLEKFTSKTLACTLKKEFDGVYGPAWHCIVGTSFGSFVTHSVGGFMYFSMDHKIYILLFKTTVQRAEEN